jgi:hypothetical protein
MTPKTERSRNKKSRDITQLPENAERAQSLTCPQFNCTAPQPISARKDHHNLYRRYSQISRGLCTFMTTALTSSPTE